MQTFPQTTQQWHTRVWRLAGPIILANLSVPLVGIVDTAVVGHLPDPVYIGAVAIGAIIFNFVFWGFGFLRMSTGGLVAQAFGARDGDRIRSLLARSAGLAVLLGVGLLLLQVPIMSIARYGFDLRGEMGSAVDSYFSTRIWSAPATLVNYAILGTLIGLQNTRFVFVQQLVLNLSNIALDLLFVIGLDMGVQGVALASLIAEYLAMTLGILLLGHELRKTPGKINRISLLDRVELSALLVLNSNILIRTLCLIGAFSLFTALGNLQGAEILAANAVLYQLLNTVAYGLDGFAHAAETLVGSALGARRQASLTSAIRYSSWWALLIAALWSGMYWLMGEWFIALITDIPAVRELAALYLPWLVAAPLVSVWSYQLDGIFIGATRSQEMRNAMLISFLFFIPLAFLMLDLFGNHGLWMSLMLFNLVRALTLGAYLPRIYHSE